MLKVHPDSTESLANLMRRNGKENHAKYLLLMQSEIDRLAARIATLEAEAEALVEVLRKAEWPDHNVKGDARCPVCLAYSVAGHVSGCELFAALRRTAPEGAQTETEESPWSLAARKTHPMKKNPWIDNTD